MRKARCHCRADTGKVEGRKALALRLKHTPDGSAPPPLPDPLCRYRFLYSPLTATLGADCVYNGSIGVTQ